MNIFVGNLPFLATENDVKGVFEAFGTVSCVSIKKKSGKNSRGFGFVSMPDDQQAQAIRMQVFNRLGDHLGVQVADGAGGDLDGGRARGADALGVVVGGEIAHDDGRGHAPAEFL